MFKIPPLGDQKLDDDPKINVDWPIKTPILSDRDKNSKFINF
jgi:dTDP-4-dehydrorhamnose 3,5-epimerase-like enzyme